MNLFSAVYEFFFGCGHDNVSRPFTLEDQTYKVCLDCGHHLPYSAQTMRYIPARMARAQMVAASARPANVLAFSAPRPVKPEGALRDSNVAA